MFTFKDENPMLSVYSRCSYVHFNRSTDMWKKSQPRIWNTDTRYRRVVPPKGGATCGMKLKCNIISILGHPLFTVLMHFLIQWNCCSMDDFSLTINQLLKVVYAAYIPMNIHTCLLLHFGFLNCFILNFSRSSKKKMNHTTKRYRYLNIHMHSHVRLEQNVKRMKFS